MAHLIPVHVLQTIDGEIATHPPTDDRQPPQEGEPAREAPKDEARDAMRSAEETYAETLLNSDKIMVVETIDRYTVITLDGWKQIVVKEPAAHVAMLTRGSTPPAA